MVFAFFGRGRVMPPIIGAGINADVLQEDATFLIGPCSCQIKDQNPGFDMLMQVNWDGVIQGEYTLAEAMPILTTPQAAAGVNKALTNLNIVQLDPTAKTVANSNGGNAGAATIALAEPISAMWRNLGIVIGAGIVFVLAIGLSMKMMGKNDRSQY